MTKDEAIKILAVLKAAYPASYKGMTKAEATGTINVWATQFYNMPYAVVMIAVNKLISINTFPPSINEVKEKIRSLYFEALQELPHSEGGFNAINKNKLPPERIHILKEIIRVCEPMRTKQRLEPTLDELLSGYGNYLLETSNNQQISGGDSESD